MTYEGPGFDHECDDDSCSCHEWFAEEKDREIESLRAWVKGLEAANELIGKRMEWESDRAAKLDCLVEDLRRELSALKQQAGEPVALTETEQGIVTDIEVMSKEHGYGFWYRTIALVTLQLIERLRNLPSSIPEGMVLVPREPTPEMLTAWWNAESVGRSPDEHRGIWKAIIEAPQKEWC